MLYRAHLVCLRVGSFHKLAWLSFDLWLKWWLCWLLDQVADAENLVSQADRLSFHWLLGSWIGQMGRFDGHFERFAARVTRVLVCVDRL